MIAYCFCRHWRTIQDKVAISCPPSTGKRLGSIASGRLLSKDEGRNLKHSVAERLQEFEAMAGDVSQDQFALIKIEGMHCHKCEQAIQRSMLRNTGVHEVEVDFASGQASVLFDPGAVTVVQLMDSV